MRRAACALGLLLCWVGSAPASPLTFRGRRLDDALRLLQQQGLPIVFSSQLVTPVMRVTAEPRAATLRGQLDELLAPHGLTAKPGPAHTLLVVRDERTPDRPAAIASAPSIRPPPRTPIRREPSPVTYADHVTVRPASATVHPGASEMTLDGETLRAAGSPIDGDGLAAVRAMPGVVTDDDFRTDFSVRGSPFDQIGIVVDGVPTRWLQHTAYGRDGAGSLSMFGGGALSSATLSVGAYPLRYDETLGGQLDLTVREGSRDATRFAATAGGVSTALMGEGPVGADGRGSWIAGVRNSYRSWPPHRPSPQNDAAFNFTDVHGKLVYDVTSSQQFAITVLGGQSSLDTMDEPFDGTYGTGTDRAALATVAWRSTLNKHSTFRQRLFLVAQDLTGATAGRTASAILSHQVLGYSGDLLYGGWGGVLNAGFDLSSLSGVQRFGAVAPAASTTVAAARWTERAGFVDFSRTVGRLSLDVGVRGTDSAAVQHGAVSPWAVGAWRFAREWTLAMSTGVSHQLPDMDSVTGFAGSPGLVAERATHMDVGIEQQLGYVRWKATLFERRESDVLRAATGALIDGGLATLVAPAVPYQNAIRGSAHGVEIVVTPKASTRLSGWTTYTYSATRQTDLMTRETYWGDFDRRHAFNASGTFALTPNASVGLVLRSASGVPVPGYFQLVDGVLSVGGKRNAVRLPAYMRLDVRAQRTFLGSRHQLTVFGEVLNALNRRNQGVSTGLVDAATGAATGFIRPLSSRQVFVGIQLDLAR